MLFTLVLVTEINKTSKKGNQKNNTIWNLKFAHQRLPHPAPLPCLPAGKERRGCPNSRTFQKAIEPFSRAKWYNRFFVC